MEQPCSHLRQRAIGCRTLGHRWAFHTSSAKELRNKEPQQPLAIPVMRLRYARRSTPHKAIDIAGTRGFASADDRPETASAGAVHSSASKNGCPDGEPSCPRSSRKKRAGSHCRRSPLSSFPCCRDAESLRATPPCHLYRDGHRQNLRAASRRAQGRASRTTVARRVERSQAGTRRLQVLASRRRRRSIRPAPTPFPPAPRLSRRR